MIITEIGDSRDRNRILVEHTTTSAISTYHH